MQVEFKRIESGVFKDWPRIRYWPVIGATIFIGCYALMKIMILVLVALGAPWHQSLLF